MQVDDKLWQVEIFGRTMQVFCGQLVEILQGLPKEAIIRAENWLPVILWKWYFLETNKENVTAYMRLNDWKKYENKWPKGGQFFPRAKLVYKSMEQIEVQINMDYIGFEEQPLLLDGRSDTEPKYNYGKYYLEDLEIYRRIKKGQGFDVLNWWGKILQKWHEEEPEEVRGVFDLWSWNEFWMKVLERISKEEFYNTIDLLDSFILKMRQKYPDYGLLNQELVNKSGEDKQRLQAYYFWMNTCRYLLIPLSFHMHLIAPIFVEEEAFFEDATELLSSAYTEPIPVMGPCTFIQMTDFGRRVLCQ